MAELTTKEDEQLDKQLHREIDAGVGDSTLRKILHEIVGPEAEDDDEGGDE